MNDQTVIKTVKRTFVAVALIWIFTVLGSLAATAGLIYVAYHFISKYW